MRLIQLLGLCSLVAVVTWVITDFDALTHWAIEEQRAVQNRMADAIRALQSGHPGALVALFSATAAYGFFHAAGPGHGKVLIGSVGIGSSVSAARLLSISVISSLGQAGWAIILVYGGFSLLHLSASRMTGLAEDVLAPASYVAFTLVGLVLIWRGIRRLRKAHAHISAQPDHDGPLHHSHDRHDGFGGHCGCHSHGPSVEEVEHLSSLRDTLALIGSIAIRPCTGAIFLLVIAWQMDLKTAGALATTVMGLGTALFTGLVAVSSVAARGAAVFMTRGYDRVFAVLTGLQIIAGALVVWGSVTLLIA